MNAGLVGRYAVHIKVNPRTRNLRESQQVLRYLQTFGPVVSFRNLKHDREEYAPHRITAVFQKPESARRLVEQSPVTIQLERPSKTVPMSDAGALMDGVGDILPETSDKQKDEAPHTDIHQSSGSSPRAVQLEIDYSLKNHVAWVKRQEFYGPYEMLNVHQSMAFHDLSKSVPLPAYAYFKHVPTPIHSSRVKAIEEAATSRKTLKQLWEERRETNPSSASPT